MKRLYSIMFLFTIILALLGCGHEEATEVGNPTGDLPTLQTITGVIDTNTIAVDVAKTIDVEKDEFAIDASLLTVVATATDESVVEAPVEPDGRFTIEVVVGKAYAFDVMRGIDLVGPFSFEQDDAGHRANRLEITQYGDPIDLGIVTFQDGQFIPQNEPRRQMGRSL